MIIPAWLLALVCAFWAVAAGLNGLGTFTAALPQPPVKGYDTDPLTAVNRIRSAGLFSHQSVLSPATEIANNKTADTPGAKLHGLATGFHGGSAFALLSVGDSTAAYLEGEEIEPGWYLHEILADRVELEADGRRATLMLSDSASPAPSRSDTPAAASEAPEPQSNDD
ncbi:MAG: type II secretion system protein N [Azoarcus sp.]|nr:type II secretion system protein N [Azoarcus sp.]